MVGRAAAKQCLIDFLGPITGGSGLSSFDFLIGFDSTMHLILNI